MLPQAEQLAELRRTADERGFAHPRDRLDRLPSAIAAQPDDRDGARVLRRAELAGGLCDQGAAKQAVGVAAREHLAGSREFVEPDRDLRGQSDEVVEALVRS